MTDAVVAIIFAITFFLFFFFFFLTRSRYLPAFYFELYSGICLNIDIFLCDTFSSCLRWFNMVFLSRVGDSFNGQNAREFHFCSQGQLLICAYIINSCHFYNTHGKLGLSENKSVISMYSTCQIIQINYLPFLITLVASISANTGLLLNVPNEMKEVLKDLESVLCLV